MTHDDLVRIAVRWLRKPASAFTNARWYKPGCGVVVPELVSYTGAIPDAVGWIASGFSYMVECKVTLADFRREQREKGCIRAGSTVGAERLYLCPADVIPVEALPETWGLLYVSHNGRRVRVVKTPTGNPNRDTIGEMGLMYSLLRRVEVHGHLTQCLSPKWGGFDPRRSNGGAVGPV